MSLSLCTISIGCRRDSGENDSWFMIRSSTIREHHRQEKGWWKPGQITENQIPAPLENL